MSASLRLAPGWRRDASGGASGSGMATPVTRGVVVEVEAGLSIPRTIGQAGPADRLFRVKPASDCWVPDTRGTPPAARTREDGLDSPSLGPLPPGVADGTRDGQRPHLAVAAPERLRSGVAMRTCSMSASAEGSAFVEELELVLAELARLFDAPPVALDACSRCYTEEDVRALTGPVDQVPADLVSSVAANPFDHWADPIGLYRRLTPRIIGMLARDELHVDPALIAHRFLEAGFSSTWSTEERYAVIAAGELWWDHAMRIYPSPTPVTDMLEFVVPISGHLGPWLASWQAQPAGPADRHLLQLCRYWLPELHDGTLELGWYGGWDIAAELTRWLLDNTPRIDRLGREAADVQRSLAALTNSRTSQ